MECGELGKSRRELQKGFLKRGEVSSRVLGVVYQQTGNLWLWIDKNLPL